jgi:hypothetical protein
VNCIDVGSTDCGISFRLTGLHFSLLYSRFALIARNLKLPDPWNISLPPTGIKPYNLKRNWHLCGIKTIPLTLTLTTGLVEPDSSVSTVSDHGLDDRAIGVRSSAEAKDFSSNLCVQTGSGAHPASCKMGTGGPFPGAERGRGVTLTTHPHLVSRSRMSRSYISSPPQAPPGRVAGQLCILEVLVQVGTAQYPVGAGVAHYSV